ncbi:MAG: ATP-binding cassette domain-containing protein, partial [Bacteroidota bacterium]
YIIVSHDRRFLNASVDKSVEVYSQKLNVYAGNYDFYEEDKELRNEIQQNAFENQQQKIREAERFITRFKAKATKAKQAQSKMKQLEKMERIDEVVDENAQVNFKFNFKTKSGRHVARLSQITKQYGALEILAATDAHIERGDKIALIGANGKGKSTALRIVAGTEPHDGKVETGHNVLTSFYAQHQLEALDVESDILEELKQQGTGKTEQELRGVLGCFLFTDDEVFKKIKVLSGGEKSRVALAKTLISESNFLLLDEPTNHLDMLSVSILVQALQQFEGTFLLVSHDRDFISKVATKIWWIEDHQIKEYPGTYEEFEWWEQQREKASSPATVPVPTSQPKKKQTKPKPADDKLQKEIKQLERAIEEKEVKAQQLEEDMGNPDNSRDLDKLTKLNEALDLIKTEIEQLTTSWEQKMMELDA